MKNLVADTLYGKLLGSEEEDIDNNKFLAFKGIPYAKPPISDLRFQVSK